MPHLEQLQHALAVYKIAAERVAHLDADNISDPTIRALCYEELKRAEERAVRCTLAVEQLQRLRINLRDFEQKP